MEPQYGKNSIKIAINVRQIMSIHYFEFKADYSFVSDIHNYWELVYVDRGKAIAKAGDRVEHLSAGEIIFHKPGEYHAIASDPAEPPAVFIVTFYCTSKDMKFFADRRMNVPTPLRKYIVEMISDGKEAYYLEEDSPIEAELRKRPDALFGSEQLIKLNLEMLLLKLIRSSVLPKVDADKEKNYDKLTRAVMDILTNCVYGRITVDAISKQLGFSRTYISAVFKENCGKTITEQLSDMKISEAKYLLRKEMYTVSQISDFLCYDNPHYFCRVFKQRTGMTPSQYIASVSYPKKEATKV